MRDLINIVENAQEQQLFYHGSKAVFDEFDPDKIQSGVGFWFTPNKDIAASFAVGVNKRGQTIRGQIVAAHLDILNPATTPEEHHRGVDEDGQPYDAYVREDAGIYVVYRPDQIRIVDILRWDRATQSFK